MKKFGTSGSRFGTTPKQRVKYFGLICDRMDGYDDPVELHDGNCVGWDDEARAVAEILHETFYNIRRIVHPCNLVNQQIELPDVIPDWWEIRPVKDPLSRNHDMALECDEMFFSPANPVKPSNLRGQGTWTTIMYAHNLRTPYLIIDRDGDTRKTLE